MNACIMLPMPQMLSFSEYLVIAKKTVRHFAPGMARRILRDEEALDQVVQSVMEADWKWDPNRVGKTGKKKTPYSFRNQHALWAVLGILEGYAKGEKKRSMKREHLESIVHACRGYNPSPEHEVLAAEQLRTTTNLADKVFKSGILSEREEAFLRLHFIDGTSKTDIAKRYGISKQAVTDSIKRTLDKLRRALWVYRDA